MTIDNILEMRDKIIAIDFDGTLVKTKAVIEDGEIKDLIILEPKFSNIEKVKKLGNNNKLILWTCREGYFLEKALTFCKEHDLIFDAVNDNIAVENKLSRKVYADYYLDDKSVLI